MLNRWQKVNAIVIFLFLILGTSCTRQRPVFHELAPLPSGGVCRLAVLPFVNETHYNDGGVIFYRVFNTELVNLGDFQLTPEGDIREAFRKELVSPGLQHPNFEKMRIIGNHLNVQVLVVGNIIEMKEYGTRGVKTPSLTVKLQLIDASTGQTLWTTYHRRQGEEYRTILHFGFVSTYTRLAERMSREILNRWIAEGLIAQCSE